MNIDDVKNIAVIGAGNMGHQISLLCAIHGFRTTCTDVKEDILQKAEAFVDSYLPGRVKKGRMTEEQDDFDDALHPGLLEGLAGQGYFFGQDFESVQDGGI